MKFRVELDVEVADHDADIMLQLPDAIKDRFDGTAIQIKRVLVEKRTIQ